MADQRDAIREPYVDHGEDFLDKQFHKLLHSMMNLREQVGEDSWLYHDIAVPRLARILAAGADRFGLLSPEERWHYFEGEHKEDCHEAAEFLQLTDMMGHRFQYNDLYIARHTEENQAQDPLHHHRRSEGIDPKFSGGMYGSGYGMGGGDAETFMHGQAFNEETNKKIADIYNSQTLYRLTNHEELPEWMKVNKKDI